jgi:hypothetical protein
MGILEKIVAGSWNTLVTPRPTGCRAGLDLGCAVVDGCATNNHVRIPQEKRAEHIVVLGKTGTGKSSFLKSHLQQDIHAGRGLAAFDPHGEITPFVLGEIAQMEQKTGQDLSEKTILIAPADGGYSVGMNALEKQEGRSPFVQIAEVTATLKRHWHLDSFGAQTEELLRNSLLALSDAGLTLVEFAPFLSNAAFRAACLKQATNPDVHDYFLSRFDRASEAMQAVMRNPILNKTSAFTADPCFRHILGQRTSTFSLTDAMDRGFVVILDTPKGKLGENAVTLVSLFLTKIKNALFARSRRSLFTLYIDELQNFVTGETGLETLFSEARKFGISVCTANQYLDQYPPAMRSAIFSVGTHCLFQLSGPDARQFTELLNGGKGLAETLKSLPPRNLVVRSGHHRCEQVEVGTVMPARASYASLVERCHKRWGQKRSVIEADIRARVSEFRSATAEEVLDGWE